MALCIRDSVVNKRHLPVHPSQLLPQEFIYKFLDEQKQKRCLQGSQLASKDVKSITGIAERAKHRIPTHVYTCSRQIFTYAANILCSFQ